MDMTYIIFCGRYEILLMFVHPLPVRVLARIFVKKVLEKFVKGCSFGPIS